MNELIREIEEDIRRERFDKLWHSFGKAMVLISIAVILATIVIEVVQNRRQSQAMEATAAFLKGIDRLNIEDYKGAVQVFSSLAGDNTSPYYGLYMMRKAQAETALSDKEAATKTYSELAAHDLVFGKLSGLLVPAGDKAEPVKPLTGEPFYYSRTESAGWQYLQQGKKDEAVNVFLALYNDPAAPSSMRGRLAEILHHIAADKLPAETSDIRDLAHE